MSNWDNLNKNEIKVLIKKYSKILRSLRCEYNKRNNVYKADINLPDDIQKTSLNVLGLLSIDDKTIRIDVLNLLDRFYKYNDWGQTHGAFTNNLLAVCIATEVLNHWRIKFDKEYILGIYDINEKSYISLSYKVRIYANKNYWRD